MGNPPESHSLPARIPPALVGGPAPALVWLLRRDSRATNCGHSAKSRPTTWNGGSAIWRLNIFLGAARNKVAQNAQGVVKGLIKGVTRASFGRRAPLTPQLKRASARRREEKDFRGVYKIQLVAAGWRQAPSLETENDRRVHSMGAT